MMTTTAEQAKETLNPRHKLTQAAAEIAYSNFNPRVQKAVVKLIDLRGMGPMSASEILLKVWLLCQANGVEIND